MNILIGILTLLALNMQLLARECAQLDINYGQPGTHDAWLSASVQCSIH